MDQIAAGIMQGVQEAQLNQSWVVLVCPNDKTALHARMLLSAAVHPSSKCAGRTVILPEGGLISVTTADKPCFVPDSQPFSVLFLAWGQGSGVETKKWRAKAREVLETSL